MYREDLRNNNYSKILVDELCYFGPGNEIEIVGEIEHEKDDLFFTGDSHLVKLKDGSMYNATSVVNSLHNEYRMIEIHFGELNFVHVGIFKKVNDKYVELGSHINVRIALNNHKVLYCEGELDFDYKYDKYNHFIVAHFLVHQDSSVYRFGYDDVFELYGDRDDNICYYVSHFKDERYGPSPILHDPHDMNEGEDLGFWDVTDDFTITSTDIKPKTKKEKDDAEEDHALDGFYEIDL